jgi:glutamine cyclotransferase
VSPYTYKWSNGKTTTSFTFSNGTYTVTVKDNHGCSETASVTVNCPAPPEERKGDEPPPAPGCCPSLIDVNLYPNPNTGQFTLSGLTQGMIVEVYDYTGRRITTINASDVTLSAGQAGMQVNISDQPNGIYLIRITDKDGTFLAQKKVVKTQ